MEKIQFKNNEAPYLSAENLNQLQTNIEEAIEEKTTYSTEEQIIGKDENGKNIYKRTFIGNLGDYDFTTFSTEYNNNTIRIKKAFGSLRSSAGAINLGSYVNSNFFSGLYVHSEELQVYHGSSLKKGTYDITLEYTKTTD